MILGRIWSFSAEYLSLDGIDDPDIRILHDHWQAVCSDAEIPCQKDLDIEVLRPHMAHIALLDIEPDTGKARYLLVGSSLTRLLGTDPTGALIEDVYHPDIAEEVGKALASMQRDRRPLFFRREFQFLGKSFGYKRLLLPMRLRGTTVRRALVCIRPTDRKLQSASQWRPHVERLEEEKRTEALMTRSWAESLGYTTDVLELDERHMIAKKP